MPALPAAWRRSLDVIEKPQLAWIKRPGEMKAEERIIHRL